LDRALAGLAAAQPLGILSLGVEGLNRYVSLAGATGSLAAIVMAGCLLGTILRRDSDVATHRDRLSWASMFTAGLLLAGLVTDTFEGINNNAATPTWCFWSAALTCIAWMLLYRLMDVAGRRCWSILIRPAGANPLVAYFLHPIVLDSVSMAGQGAGPRRAVRSVGGGRGLAGDGACSLRRHGPLGRLGLRVRL
jgi:predicted acyltransferase